MFQVTREVCAKHNAVRFRTIPAGIRRPWRVSAAQCTVAGNPVNACAAKAKNDRSFS